MRFRSPHDLMNVMSGVEVLYTAISLVLKSIYNITFHPLHSTYFTTAGLPAVHPLLQPCVHPPGQCTASQMPGLVHPSDEACESISARLSSMQDLRLPAMLLRQQQDHPPDTAAVQQHLKDLLHRDAAVFLERYALLLSAEERDTFQPLRGHYEVNFYLQQAEAANQQQQQQQQQQSGSRRVQQHLSSTVKNRRLAFMRRLEQQGEYFSEHAMRQREPLVWQECIGRHEGQPTVPPAAAAGERGFAGSLLASYDEAMLQARLQQQIEDEEAAMSEHESDSESYADAEADAAIDADVNADADGGNEQHHPQQQHQGQNGSAIPPPAAALRPNSISTPSAAAAGRTQAARARAAEAQAQPPQQQQQGSAAAAAGAVDMGPGVMARRRHEFLLEMQHRFLDGLDGEHQDYSEIDGDVELDEDWAKQQAQDAEDAYFDAD